MYRALLLVTAATLGWLPQSAWAQFGPTQVEELVVTAAAAPLSATQLSRGGRALTAGPLLLTAALHLVLRRGDDPMGWIVDLALGLIALALLLSLVRRAPMHSA